VPDRELRGTERTDAAIEVLLSGITKQGRDTLRSPSGGATALSTPARRRDHVASPSQTTPAPDKQQDQVGYGLYSYSSRSGSSERYTMTCRSGAGTNTAARRCETAIRDTKRTLRFYLLVAPLQASPPAPSALTWPSPSQTPERPVETRVGTVEVDIPGRAHHAARTSEHGVCCCWCCFIVAKQSAPTRPSAIQKQI
jgi:hypothetical protein